MTTVGKVVGGGAVVVGSSGAVGYGVKYVLEMEPSFTTLASATDFDSNYKSKYGNKDENKNSFVDPDKNEKWWNWVHENLLKIDKDNQKDEVYSDFSSVTKGYSSTDNDTISLNQVCKTAFKKESKTVVNIKYKKNIWKYCSKDRDNLDKHETPPAFVGLDDSKASSVQVTGNDKLGSVAGNKPKLIADIQDNEEGWNWIYENRLKGDIANATKKAEMDTSFSSITSGYSSTDVTTALNKVCKTSYDKKKTDLEGSNDKLKKNIETYCTKDGTSLTLPTN